MCFSSLYKIEDLIFVFNDIFKINSQTILVSGGDEPVYLPRTSIQKYDQIVFTKDYYSSALHEISHWCIAGKERRKHIDYGYWYAPDGRSNERQALFEQVEIKPQALECIFSKMAGHSFNVSVDNLNGEPHDIKIFEQNVAAQVENYLSAHLPKRAEMFRRALKCFYGRKTSQTKVA